MTTYPIICERCNTAVLGTRTMPDGVSPPATSGMICSDCVAAWQAEREAHRVAEYDRETAELKKRLGLDRQMEELGVLLHGRHIDEDLAALLEKASPATPVSVAYLDMNGLKSINDQHGHDAGDDAIFQYLQVVRAASKRNATAYRRKDGGDEVIIIMPNTDTASAIERMRELLTRLGSTLCLAGSSTLRLAASCGVATAHGNEIATDLIRRADAAMYAAKKQSKAAGVGSSIAAHGGDPEIV